MILVEKRQVITEISLGVNNSMILLKSGMIGICGDNSQSQLTLEGGDPFLSFSVIPKLMEICRIQCSTFLTAQNFDRELFIFGAVPFLETYLTETTNGFWKLDGYNLILDYSVGDNFIIINDVKAGVFTCGKNDKGQLGRSNDMGTGFDVVTQLIQVKIKSICCGHDFVLCELGVKPLHPRDELLIQRLEEMERSIGNEDMPGMQGGNILANLEATPDQKAEINSDFRNSTNMGANNGFEINQKKTTVNGRELIRRTISRKQLPKSGRKYEAGFKQNQRTRQSFGKCRK